MSMASESLSPVIANFFTASSHGADAVSDVELRSFQASAQGQTPHVRLFHAISIIQDIRLIFL